MRCAARARAAVVELARELHCGPEALATLTRISDLLTAQPLRERARGAVLRATPVEEPPRWGLRLVCEHERRVRVLTSPHSPAARIERIARLADAVGLSESSTGARRLERITCLVWQRSPASPSLDCFARCACPECLGACPRSHLAHVREGITTLCLVSGIERSSAAERAAQRALEAIQDELEGSLEHGLERARAALRASLAAGLALARIDPDRGRIEHASLGRMRCKLWPGRLLPRVRGHARRRSRTALHTSAWQPDAVLWMVPDLAWLPLPVNPPHLPAGVDARGEASRLVTRNGARRAAHPVALVARAAPLAADNARPLHLGLAQRD